MTDYIEAAKSRLAEVLADAASWDVADARTIVEGEGGDDVPTLVEPLALGMELLAMGYVDAHVVTFTRSGYGLEHPIRCRPDLNGCAFNRYLAALNGPRQRPGRYLMRKLGDYVLAPSDPIALRDLAASRREAVSL